MPIDLCSCHGQPLTWCPHLKGRAVVTVAPLPTVDGAVVGPDGIPHEPWVSADGMSYDLTECATDCPGWHEGTVVQVDRGGNCGICGDTYFPGEQVVKLPLPAYGFPYSHAICEPSPS